MMKDNFFKALGAALFLMFITLIFILSIIGILPNLKKKQMRVIYLRGHTPLEYIFLLLAIFHGQGLIQA